jgi:hypothetical protein
MDVMNLFVVPLDDHDRRHAVNKTFRPSLFET